MQRTDNIFLVGLMGSGKSTVGRHLARRLRRRFIDSDHEIEARTGVGIPLIFEIEGEAGFRAREQAMIEELTTLAGVVLATGGGAVLAAENRSALRARGIVVYLRAAVDDLFARTRHDRNRPLLQTPDPRAKLAELFGQRDPLYQEVADVTVESGAQNVHGLVRRLEIQLAGLGVHPLETECKA